MSRDKNIFTKTALFKPSTIRNFFDGALVVKNVTMGGNKDKEQENTNIINTGSFRYDPAGTALKSTQQLNVDWSKWENHTFFNSAQVKVQTALNAVINKYPFDGNKSEYIGYADELTGFEKYILDSFPKNKGCLKFDRSHNNYLSVSDFQGAGTTTPGILGASGKSVVDFSYLPFTAEAHVFIPSGSINDNEIILQRVSGTNKGLTLAVSSSKFESSTMGEVTVYAYLSSGSTALSSSVKIAKGKFHQIGAVYDRNNTGKLFMYHNGIKVHTSSQAAVFDDYGFQLNNITIGSGTLHSAGNLSFQPVQNLSGALDELRFFHEKRSTKQIKTFGDKQIFSSTNKKLRLYYRFNEPSGSFSDGGNSSLVLDYSGNGLHSSIQNFNMDLRNTGSLPTALSAEDIRMSPILFPAFNSVSSYAADLLMSASQYDYNNPNMIAKLIPNHYLQDASFAQGMESEWGNIGDDPTFTSDAPGGLQMGAPQIISSLLYMWAQSFDEIKMFVDEFGRLLTVDYRSENTISNHLLPFLSRYYGLNLPNQFANATMEQLVDNQNIRMDNVASVMGLQDIQNIIWRRILTSLPEVVKSKGTHHSLGCLFRSMGINPDGAFRVREYGGSRTKSISDSFEKRSEIAALLDFSGSNSLPGTIDDSGRDSSRPLIQSRYLSGARVEPGVPTAKGTFVSGKSNYSGDGLFTSGSWTLEGVFKLQGASHTVSQSLMRIQTTGSRGHGSPAATNNWLIFNAVATKELTSSNQPGSITLYGRPVSGTSAPTLSLSLTGVNIFDGNKWHVSYGRMRNDTIGSYVSSSYFLRAGRVSSDRIAEYYTTSSFYDDHGDNVMNRVSGSNNASGSFVVIGSQSLKYDSTLSEGGFLNNTSTNQSRYVNFSGKCSGVRFFSKALPEKATLMHIKNFKSLGVENPEINFNFNTANSGSFQRMRMNLSCDQPITNSNASGQIRIFDFSQNNLHASGSGFEASKRTVKPERYNYMILSPRFELAVDPNKIRIRSFEQLENIRANGLDAQTGFAPMYSIPENEQPKDDRRLSIEVSSVQALNEDITNIFATLDAIDSAIGNPELVFSEEYRSLRNLRSIYFNRLTEQMSLTKFFEFFKWFDSTIGDILEEVIPSTSTYMGTNFVVESHSLERAKFTYKYSDMYVGVLDRREASVIFMQQFLGTLRKF